MTFSKSIPDPKPVIVLVDGAVDHLVLLHRIICQIVEDHEVIPVAEAAEALVHVRLRPVLLVITEYVLLDKMNGLQLIAEIKQLSPHTHVLLHTMYGTPALERSARESGVDYYLPKPASSDDLEFVIRTACQRAKPLSNSADKLIGAFADALYRANHWSPEVAHAAARYFYLHAQQDYHTAHTPYGDTHEGLMRWIEKRVTGGYSGWLNKAE
jgi:DNA-binding NarL/FixJ family response regulator